MKVFKVFIRCEDCRKKCSHRGEVHKRTGDRVDGCIVTEEDYKRFANGRMSETTRLLR